MFLQETYEVQDLWYFDECTSNKGHWTDNTVISFNQNGMLITGVTELDIDYPTNFVLECTLTEPNNPNNWTGALHCRGVGFVGERSTSYWYDDNVADSYITKSSGYRITNGVKIKIIVENGTTSIYYNNTFVRDVSTMANAKLALDNSPENVCQLRIKDLTIKQL